MAKEPGELASSAQVNSSAARSKKGYLFDLIRSSLKPNHHLSPDSSPSNYLPSNVGNYELISYSLRSSCSSQSNQTKPFYFPGAGHLCRRSGRIGRGKPVGNGRGWRLPPPPPKPRCLFISIPAEKSNSKLELQPIIWKMSSERPRWEKKPHDCFVQEMRRWEEEVHFMYLIEQHQGKCFKWRKRLKIGNCNNYFTFIRKQQNFSWLLSPYDVIAAVACLLGHSNWTFQKTSGQFRPPQFSRRKRLIKLFHVVMNKSCVCISMSLIPSLSFPSRWIMAVVQYEKGEKINITNFVQSGRYVFAKNVK